MIKGRSVVAVIPARGGSKRIPRKNMERYKGKTLVEWAVNSARESEYIDHFCVSSDDSEILKHAEGLKATALHRPDWLADDRAMNEGVMVHTLYTWKWADWIVLLQPTSPQRTGKDIDLCLERAQMGTGCVTFNENGQRNGAVYVVRSAALISRMSFSIDILDQFMLMPNDRSLDIDYPQDLAA